MEVTQLLFKYLKIIQNYTEVAAPTKNFESASFKEKQCDPMIWIALQSSVLMSDEECTTTKQKLQVSKSKFASFDVRDQDGRTAHQIATQGGKHRLATLLAMEANTIANKQLRLSQIHHLAEGYSASSEVERHQQLIAAVESGNVEQVQRLLKMVSDIEAALTDDGCNCLHIAAKCGHLELVQLMASCVYNINCRDKMFKTPLMYATLEGHVDVVVYLLRSGANPSYHDKEFNTLLHIAVRVKNLDLLQIILVNATNLSIWTRNCYGASALKIAEDVGDPRIIDALQDKINALNHYNAETI
jgi:ankyrin repeat protein